MDEHTSGLHGAELLADPYFVKQIKALRSKIVHSIDTTEKNVLGITSATDGEGKTTLALNITKSISANGDKKVLLIDCDMIRCDLSNILGFNGNPGLSDYLDGQENRTDFVLKNYYRKNLFVMPSGNHIESSSELLTKNVFRNLVDVVRRKFDTVLLDLPPVISAPDPVSVKEMIDKFIFVYHAGRTPRELVEEAFNEIGEEKILGVVFNKVKDDSILKNKKKYYYYSR